MALVDLQNIFKHYEAQKILENVDFHIDEGERVAIVGKNGSGKSTLMKIAAGLLDYDDGKRITQQNCKVEMLAQVPKFREGITVREAVEQELTELHEAKRCHAELSHKIAETPDDKHILDELTKVSSYLDFHNAWNLDDKIERVMQVFDLKAYEERPVQSLSGGEQRRVALAGLILKKPDLLLLDEPTNHLDVYMVKFLEEILLAEKFTILCISHDRYFIEKLATRTVEVEDAKIRSFKGGYQSYLEQKEMLLQSMVKTHETLLKHLKAEEEWLRGGVRARLKRNEGRKARLMDMRQEAKKNPGVIRKITMELEREQKAFNRTEDAKNKKKMLFEIDYLNLTLGGKTLIKDFTTRILQRDKIAVVGKNGAGKSTLLRIMLGTLKPDAGKIKRGEFTIGYFDQHREMLDDNKDLIETFCPQGGDRVDVRGSNMHVYGYLKQWLFPKEFLDKKIGTLSGGEKNRVALALLFTKKVDCLILDEPTNDLDIPTINILEEFLQTFDGALMFVSHDRYFVDKIAKKLFIFKGDGRIEESYQSYTEYLEIEEALGEIEAFEGELEKEKSAPAPMQEQPKKATKLSYKEQREYDMLPDQIEELEAKVKGLEECLADPACYQEKGLVKISEELDTARTELDEKVERYLEIEEKVESFQNA